ncbi:MAG: ATP-binding protein [Bacteroidota bacterium]
METKELRNLRFLLLIFMILSPMTASNLVKINPEVYEPMAPRIVLSSLYFAFLLGTFYVDFVKKQFRTIVLLFAYGVTAYQAYLMIRNHFDKTYISSYIFLAFLVILYLKTYLHVISYAVISLVLLTGIYLAYKDHDINLGLAHLKFLFGINLVFTIIRVYGIRKDERLLKYSRDLNSSEEKFRNLLNSAPDVIFTLDKEGVIKGLNKSSSRLFGFRDNELIGTSIDLLVRTDEENPVKISDTLAYDEEVDFGKPLRAKRKNGEEFLVEMSLSPVIDSENKETIAVIRDITKRINDEKEMDAMRHKLQEKEFAEKISKAKSEFISKMSHEIRTPLNGIYGFTNIMLKENLNPDHKKYLDNIKFSSELLSILINDILDNTNLETGKISLEQHEIDIKLLINSLTNVFKIPLSEKNIRLKLNFDGHIDRSEIKITGDSLRLSQILMNLLSNAIKFSEVNGEIIIDASLEQIDAERVRVKINVTDTGIGIPKDKITDIFQPYVQVSNEISKKFGGTGLGLSIVKNIIDLMKGEISVISGEKTVFSIAIPFDVSHPQDKKQEKEKISVKLNQDIKVLVAEDNMMNQFLIRTILENNRIQHKIVENGMLALREVQQDKYDIVLMDLMMPEMDGIESARRIKGECMLKIPIVALTADVKSSNSEEIESLFDGYIKKPFEEDELLQLIMKLAG